MPKRCAAGLVSLLILSACQKAPQSRIAPVRVRIAPSPSAPQLLEVFSHLPNVVVEDAAARDGGPNGSLAVLSALQDGTIDIGAATADVAYLAYAGQLNDRPAFTQLRSITVLGMNVVHLIVRKDLRIRVASASDLRGLRVSLGSAGSGTALVAERLLKTSGLDLPDIRASFLTYQEAARRLGAGQLDAIFGLFSTELRNRLPDGARLVELDGGDVERLRLQQPFLSRTLIPHDTYPHQESAIWTLGIDLLLVCRTELSQDLVYRFMETYFSQLDQGTRPAVNLDRAAITSIPLHPAAVRFFRRRELSP